MTSIDAANPATVSPPIPQIRRPDQGKVIAEAYNNPNKAIPPSPGDGYENKIKDEAVEAKGDSANAGKVGNADRDLSAYGRRSKTRVLNKDEAELNFQLTREERDVFINAMSGNESVSEMSDEEQKLLQKTAERIEKILEAVDTRTEEGRERADAAIKEWYSRLANGKFKAPTDLMRLIQAAALGKEDLTKV